MTIFGGYIYGSRVLQNQTRLRSHLKYALINHMTISRRLCLPWIFLLLSLVPVTISAAKDSQKDKYLLFVGTYTQKESKGIYAYRFDAASSQPPPLGVAAETTNPSFLTIDPSRRFLYAVNEVQKYKGANSGAVSAFAINRETGKLSLLNEVASRGADPCSIALDKTVNYVLVANYPGGNVAVFPIHADGRLGESSAVLQDIGTLGPVKERQEAPHGHWIEASAHTRFVYVSDLGLDRVLIYRFDATNGTLTKCEAAAPKSGSPNAIYFFSASLYPCTGARHVAFSRNGNFIYVLGQLDSSVTVFANDA